MKIVKMTDPKGSSEHAQVSNTEGTSGKNGSEGIQIENNLGGNGQEKNLNNTGNGKTNETHHEVNKDRENDEHSEVESEDSEIREGRKALQNRLKEKEREYYRLLRYADDGDLENSIYKTANSMTIREVLP